MVRGRAQELKFRMLNARRADADKKSVDLRRRF